MQEGILQHRHARNQMIQGTEMDTATMLYTMDPSERYEVLMELSDAQLMTLPSELIAEAIVLRNRSGRHGYERHFGYDDATGLRPGALMTAGTESERQSNNNEEKTNEQKSNEQKSSKQKQDDGSINNYNNENSNENKQDNDKEKEKENENDQNADMTEKEKQIVVKKTKEEIAEEKRLKIIQSLCKESPISSSANKYLILQHVVSESHRLSECIVKELKMIHNIIAPGERSSNRFTESWTISSKQSALLRNIEFFNTLIDVKVAFEFDFYKKNFKDKTKKNQNKEKKEDENEETEENLKEKRLIHEQQQEMLADCSRGLESLWHALDKVLQVFGYVPKEVLKDQIKDAEAAEKENEKKKEKDADEKDKEKYKKGKKKGKEQANLKAVKQVLKQGKRNKKEEQKITSSVLQLQPLIRAFFMLHDYAEVDAKTKKTPEEMEESLSDGLSSDYMKERHKYFLDFTDKHRNIFNLLITHKEDLLLGTRIQRRHMLMSLNDGKLGPFASLIWHPRRILDLHNKKKYLRYRLDEIKANEWSNNPESRCLGSATRLSPRRKNLFLDCYHQMRCWTKSELMNRLSIRFLNEDGFDAGGLTREFYQSISKEMCNPNHGLFKPSADNHSVFQPNVNSYYNRDHLEYFKFVGMIVAKTIFDNQNLDAYFTRSFLKQTLDVRPTWDDLQSLDYNKYKSFRWMLNNSINSIIFSRFEYTYDRFGRDKHVELKENGKDIDLDDSNKREYVELVAELEMTKQIEMQLNAFKQGFSVLIPKWLISIFSWAELELLACGVPEIDVADLRSNTEYRGFGGHGHRHGLHRAQANQNQVIEWFWDVVENEFDKEEKALLLQFVTGTSKVPLGGFAHLPGMEGIQRFQIHAAAGNDATLPSTRTCFNQLDLPLYSSKQIFKEKLLLALRECSQGFGLA